jgi:hypothetical protein
MKITGFMGFLAFFIRLLICELTGFAEDFFKMKDTSNCFIENAF